jgi:hypothetical protein
MRQLHQRMQTNYMYGNAKDGLDGMLFPIQ